MLAADADINGSTGDFARQLARFQFCDLKAESWAIRPDRTDGMRQESSAYRWRAAQPELAAFSTAPTNPEYGSVNDSPLRIGGPPW